MSQWEKEFAGQMEALRTRSSACFERVVHEVLQPAFESISAFVGKWKFHTSTPSSDPGRLCYKFALTEDAYVLVRWRFEGVDALECEYECWIPGSGRVNGVRTSGSLRAVDHEWVESCFQLALSNFVTKFAETEHRQKTPEPVLV